MVLKSHELTGVVILYGLIFVWSLPTHNRSRMYDAGSMHIGREENNPPIVKIIEPKNNSIHPLNSHLRYSISVSDKEDGESKYDEIPPDKIFLEIRFVSETSKATPNQKPVQEALGLRHIKNSDCFNCHQFNTRLIGPSFSEIASRYSKTTDAMQILARRITDGSQAEWGEGIMPAHPDISMEASQQIVDWILKEGLNENLNYLPGKEGSFWTNLPPAASKGFFVLKAVYTDKGLPDSPAKTLTGQDVVIIHIN